MASLYGDLPEATEVVAPKAEVKMQPLPLPTKDPSRVIFLDIEPFLTLHPFFISFSIHYS